MSRRRLFATLTAAGCLAAATSSAAVEVNPDGIGQVLLYPYYTVRSSGAGNALNTLLTIGNTTDHIKALRLRFREGAVGVSVAELNIYLGARDMWSAGVIPREDGGAELVSVDHSCTVPPVYDVVTSTWLGFSSAAYSGDPLDGSVDRTREGFFEVIEMGDYGPASAAAPGSVAAGASPIGDVPFDCGRVQADTGAEAQPGTGGLFGRAILINVGDGTEFAYSATALANFNTTRSLWAAADTPAPTLADVAPPISVVRSSNLGTIHTQWAQPIDAVSAVLMHETISNEYVLDQGTRSLTDWVVTMPTKPYYVNASLNPTRLFQSPLAAIGACEVVLPPGHGALIFDREGRTVYWHNTGQGLPPESQRAFCWATTVIAFIQTFETPPKTLLGSTHPYEIPNDPRHPTSTSPGPIVASYPFYNGWLKIPLNVAEDFSLTLVPPQVSEAHYLVGGATTQLKPDGSVESRPQATYYGLPVIGFAAESYTNGTLVINGQRVLANYGGLIDHRYTDHVE